MKQYLLIATLSVAFAVTPFAQDNRNVMEEYEKFRNQAKKEYSDFRTRANADYAHFMREAWKNFESEEAVPAPVIPDNPVPPVIIPKDTPKPKPENKPLPIDTLIDKPVLPPAPPKPVAPIPEIKESQEQWFEFVFYGTPCRVRLSENRRFHLPDTETETLAEHWEKLSQPDYNNLINDCLASREKLSLCDWAYLQLLATLCDTFLGASSNESTFLQFFLLVQSGYKARLGQDNKGTIYLLYASDYSIYGKSYYRLDAGKFYLAKEPSEKSLHILNQPYEKEQTLSLLIPNAQQFSEKQSNERTLVSEQYSSASVKILTNKNLIDFYDTYPASTLNNDESTRWRFYANTPLSESAKQMLYPALYQAIADKSEEDAANILLNFVQTAFVYEFDDKVWGGDRAFFAEETLYYPYSDCEDRAILFSRLVRDLMHLEVVLLYFPGHLAAAVHFNENIDGDYLTVADKRFLVCDPTYINAPVGMTMEGYENKKITVVTLNNTESKK
ncbi:MAG: hypothetical protein LBS25_00660 [Candidatus Symbiothrix sp.]|nr:hypothetical protein [Candidatus Symbiothrix sp.]